MVDETPTRSHGCLLTLIAVSAFSAIFCWGVVLESTSDVLWREAHSPDGKWSVHVYWHHVSSMPGTFHVRFDLVVRDWEGRTVLRRELGEAEMYTDIADDFAPVTCENDHAMIGDIRLEKLSALPINHWGSRVQYPMTP